MPRGEHNHRGGLSSHERTQEALKTLEESIAAILTGGAFADYLRIMARFHLYSAGNVALIRFQRPDATRVAGYQRWKELGRQVDKEEKATKFLVAHEYKVTSENEGEERLVVGRYV